MNGAFCFFTPVMPVLDSLCWLLQTLHDDRSSGRIHRNARHGQGIEAMLLGARRRLLSPRSAKNEDKAKSESLRCSTGIGRHGSPPRRLAPGFLPPVVGN